MSDKAKIITIYASVVVISALIAATAYYLRGQQPRPEIKPQYAEDTDFTPLYMLNEDITLKRQDGQEVKISQLNGKVWVFLQFFANCPMCLKRNDHGLTSLYEKFKDHPDFVIVCVTVDPENDGVEEMAGYAEALGADASNWWFLTGDPDKLLPYMENTIQYSKIQKREDPEEAAIKGAFAHDMQFAVFDRNLGMVRRVNLDRDFLKDDASYRGMEKKLHFMIQTLLDRKNS